MTTQDKSSGTAVTAKIWPETPLTGWGHTSWTCKAQDFIFCNARRSTELFMKSHMSIDCCLTCAYSSPWLLLSSFFSHICLPRSHSFPAISFPLCQPVKSKLAVKSSYSARSSVQAPGEDKWYELYGPTVKYSIKPQWDIQKSFTSSQ